MLIHGFHAVAARLKRGGEGVRELYVAGSRDDARVRDLVKLAEQGGVRPIFVDGARIDRLCPGRRHQGVVLVAEAALPGADLETILAPERHPRLLLLDGVTDPRNLGACLRVADAAGVTAVIAPKDHACPLTEVAIQTASGAAESVPYLMVTNLVRAMDRIKEAGMWLVGTADDAPTSLYECEIPQPAAWVLGAEGKGLRRLTRERCDLLVRIPMAGSVSSLNVSVAAGVVLFESVRQQAARSRTAP
ncbi:MAG TPA: 23S rRNA (guanosine(2251)-2'-O)-methyltransferase RlmB [Burkholderiaceae bacterium]